MWMFDDIKSIDAKLAYALGSFEAAFLLSELVQQHSFAEMNKGIHIDGSFKLHDSASYYMTDRQFDDAIKLLIHHKLVLAFGYGRVLLAGDEMDSIIEQLKDGVK